MKRGQSDRVLIAMGVCGAGKSALAHMLSSRRGLPLVEADFHHSDTARAAMSRGEPLGDAERLPWLDRVGQAARTALEESGGVVIACSALRKTYRDRLRKYLPEAYFVHLTGSRELIAGRLDERHDHFVGKTLLDSQLSTLEPLEQDENGMVLDVAAPLERLVDTVLHKMGDTDENASLYTGPVPDTLANRKK